MSGNRCNMVVIQYSCYYVNPMAFYNWYHHKSLTTCSCQKIPLDEFHCTANRIWNVFIYIRIFLFRTKMHLLLCQCNHNVHYFFSTTF
jgi:hypothetical protein